MNRKKRNVVLGMLLAAACTFSGCSSSEGEAGPLDGAKDLLNNAKEAVMGVVGGLFGEEAGSEDTVAVQSVSMLAGIGAYGIQDRYTGIVVAQQTQNINKQEDRTVKELKVAVGDTVKTGDVLFSYDLEEMQLAVDTGKLELEKLQNSITSTNQQIEQLERDKAKAAQSDQLSYSIEIQSLQADVKEYEYQLQTKTVAQELLEKTLGNAEVTAPIDGVIQSINDNGSNEDDYSSSNAYIVIMETGNYRIKGTINEMNRAAMIGMEGQPIIIRSRVNDTDIWYGKLDKVDTENPIQQENDYYSSSGDENSTSTNYPFYVSLDSSDGLMMGQHVYIELDQGQEEQRKGIWLPSTFIDLDGGTFIWAANSKDKLEKREVTLGDYDKDLDQYEILEGISATDYVAIADVSLREGAPVTRYDEAYFEEEDWGDEDEWGEDESWSEDDEWYEDESGWDGWEDDWDGEDGLMLESDMDWGDGDEEVEWDDELETEEDLEADDVVDLGEDEEVFAIDEDIEVQFEDETVFNAPEESGEGLQETQRAE